jgi:2-dehydro-3-deoxygluconokinase
MGPEIVPTLPIETSHIIHLTGITPALSSSCREMIEEVMRRAEKASRLVSFDVNYREALWPIEDARGHLMSLSSQAGGVFVGLDEARTLWGCETPADVRGLFPKADWLVVKNDGHGATEFTAVSETFVPAESLDVVEVVGAGDAFAAGYLGGLLSGLESADRLKLAHRRAAMVLRSTADLPPPPLDEHRPQKRVTFDPPGE